MNGKYKGWKIKSLPNAMEEQKVLESKVVLLHMIGNLDLSCSVQLGIIPPCEGLSVFVVGLCKLLMAVFY